MLQKFLKTMAVTGGIYAAAAIAGPFAGTANATDTINFGTQPATMPIYIAKAM